MAAVVYILCAITSGVCAFLLYRGYHRSATKLLLWSAICFATQAINNILLFYDLIIIPDGADLGILRVSINLGGMAFLLFGFIWDTI